MASERPGDILTQPRDKIVFSAPFDERHTYHVKIINGGGRRIGWAYLNAKSWFLGLDPPCGVLDPNESVLMAVSRDSFDIADQDLHVYDSGRDRITIQWTNAPEGAAKQFRREWFQGDCMVRRKNLTIEYNL